MQRASKAGPSVNISLRLFFFTKNPLRQGTHSLQSDRAAGGRELCASYWVFVCRGGIWLRPHHVEVPRPGMGPPHSRNLCHRGGKARPLTCCSTWDLPKLLSISMKVTLSCSAMRELGLWEPHFRFAGSSTSGSANRGTRGSLQPWKGRRNLFLPTCFLVTSCLLPGDSCLLRATSYLPAVARPRPGSCSPLPKCLNPAQSWAPNASEGHRLPVHEVRVRRLVLGVSGRKLEREHSLPRRCKATAGENPQEGPTPSSPFPSLRLPPIHKI